MISLFIILVLLFLYGIYLDKKDEKKVIKPSGSASVTLKIDSGIHPTQSKGYVRIMPIKKEKI